jgi:putative ABC transport system substrate-binding protein
MLASLRKILITGLVWMISSGIAGAEEAKKLPKIGQVFLTTPSSTKRVEDWLRNGLYELGYVDGKNIEVIPRYAQRDLSQLPRLFSELIALHVDVLFVSLDTLPAALQATRTIPIVCPVMGDPVRDGFATSLAHPGGNVTGGSALGMGTMSKRLQLAMELVPGLKRAGLLYDSNNPDYLASAEDARVLAENLGLSFHRYGIRSADELRSALARLDKDRLQAVIVWCTPLMLQQLQTILDHLSRNKIPVIGDCQNQLEAGAIVTYAADYMEMWKHSAVYVDRILKGAKPSDIPIEQATKFTLKVNLKSARDLGINIPDSILLQADEIIR